MMVCLKLIIIIQVILNTKFVFLLFYCQRKKNLVAVYYPPHQIFMYIWYNTSFYYRHTHKQYANFVQ